MLDSREAWFKGGDTGPAIPYGDPENATAADDGAIESQAERGEYELKPCAR